MTPFLLHFLRHGAPTRPGRLHGHGDAAPSKAGIEACVERVQDLAFTRIIASDLSRARRAAEAIAAPRGLPVHLDTRWRELDFGHWDGLSPSEVDADRLARFWADPEADRPPDGERWSQLMARVAAAVELLPAENSLVVAHGGAIRAALAHLCGFELPQLWAIDLPYAALLSLRVWPGPKPSAQIVGLAT
jgi:alpha-ribazole phosphatase